jgi:hypothetical protein
MERRMDHETACQATHDLMDVGAVALTAAELEHVVAGGRRHARKSRRPCMNSPRPYSPA